LLTGGGVDGANQFGQWSRSDQIGNAVLAKNQQVGLSRKELPGLIPGQHAAIDQPLGQGWAVRPGSAGRAPKRGVQRLGFVQRDRARSDCQFPEILNRKRHRGKVFE
jgi:hypothetical protein